jgi:hypothetical protein
MANQVPDIQARSLSSLMYTLENLRVLFSAVDNEITRSAYLVDGSDLWTTTRQQVKKQFRKAPAWQPTDSGKDTGQALKILFPGIFHERRQ